MTKECWINLPVKDLAAAKQFFARIGFSFNEAFTANKEMACMFVGDKKLVFMLVAEDLFRTFVQHAITDTTQSCEVLFSIDAESRQEVDDMAAKAQEAGAVLFGKPQESQGWLYGCAFADLDGHRWNILFRDMSKMQNK